MSKAAIGNVQELLWMIPIMIPKDPKADAKISTISTFTNIDRSGRHQSHMLILKFPQKHRILH